MSGNKTKEKKQEKPAEKPSEEPSEGKGSVARKIFTSKIAKIIYVLLGVYVLLGIAGALYFNNSAIVTEVRNTADFNAIRYEGSGKLVIRQTGDEKLQIEAKQKLQPHLKAEVINGTLVLSVSKGLSLFSAVEFLIPNPTYYIDVDELATLDLSGLSNVEIESLNSDDFSLRTSGSSRVSAVIYANKFGLDTSGSANVRLNGSAETQTINTSGSAKYEALDFVTQNADIETSGSATISVHVENRLEVDISGSGRVQYKGNPTVSQDISGSGKVEKID